MKRVLLLLIPAIMAAPACIEDVIETTEDPIEAPAGNDDDQDPEEPEGDWDDITLTSFDRTVSIKWNGSSATVEGDANNTVTVSGGVLDVTSTGQGGKGISGDQKAYFKGGTVTVNVTGSNLSNSSGGYRAPGGSPGGPGGGGGFPGGESSNLKSAKGIKFDGDILISGGSISVSASSHEAIESKGKLEVTGGVLYAYSPADDAINSAGDMTLSGGETVWGGNGFAPGSVSEGSSVNLSAYSSSGR